MIGFISQSEYQLHQLKYREEFFPISLTKALWRNMLSSKPLSWKPAAPCLQPGGMAFEAPAFGGILMLQKDNCTESYSLRYRHPELAPLSGQNVLLRKLLDPGRIHVTAYDLPQLYWGLANGAVSHRIEPDFLHAIETHLTAARKALSEPDCQYCLLYRRYGQEETHQELSSAYIPEK